MILRSFGLARSFSCLRQCTQQSTSYSTSILDRYHMIQEDDTPDPHGHQRLLELVEAKKYFAAEKHLAYLKGYKKSIEPHTAYEGPALHCIRGHNNPNYITFFRWLSITPGRLQSSSGRTKRPYVSITQELCRSGALAKKKYYILRFAVMVAAKGYYNEVVRRDVLPVLAQPHFIADAAELKSVWSDIETQALEYEAATRSAYTIALGRTMRNDLVTLLAELGWLSDAVDMATKKSPFMQMNQKHLRNLKLKLQEVGDEKGLQRLEAFNTKQSALVLPFPSPQLTEGHFQILRHPLSLVSPSLEHTSSLRRHLQFSAPGAQFVIYLSVSFIQFVCCC